MNAPIPGAESVARGGSGGEQGRFWEMHDWLYEQEPPLSESQPAFARATGLAMARFSRDLETAEPRVVTISPKATQRRYRHADTVCRWAALDGAWIYSMLEALQRPVAQRVQRSARVRQFACVRRVCAVADGAVAIFCANLPLAPYYRTIEAPVGIPFPRMMSLTVGEWFSGRLARDLLLVVGLEIRREMTAGALQFKAAILPAIGAMGGARAGGDLPRAQSGVGVPGRSIPTATDIAFTLGIPRCSAIEYQRTS
jgi:NhaA family Na+:H+ antiporter